MAAFSNCRQSANACRGKAKSSNHIFRRRSVDNKEYQRALVFAAKNGNDKCFEELYKLYYQKIYALALTTLKNADAMKRP
jgi:hypothetical protein